MTRNKSYRRSQRERVINKKKKFIKLAGNYWHFEHEGSLSKGKIHCSCRMCRYSSTHKELIRKRKNMLELDEKEQIQEINPNDCDKCIWRNNMYKKDFEKYGWCHWWYTEPTVECLYDKGN